MAVAERIAQARRGAGMSLRDVAGRAGVSAQAVSKYERGLDMPSSGVLLRLAEALGVQVEYFFRPRRVAVQVAAYRRQAPLTRKGEAFVVGQIQDWLERYLAIEEIVLGEEELPFVPPQHVRTEIESIEDAERVADELRRSWDLGTTPIGNLTELLEDKGIKVGIIEGDPNFDGCTLLTEDGTPVIVIKRGLSGDRQRFTLAHELGHILLKVPPSLDEEQAAHRFAGALLVPASRVRDELGARRTSIQPFELHLLKHKYGLSMQGWVHRAREAGVMTEAKARQHLREWNRQGWRQQEPGTSLPAEQPYRMERLILRACEEEIISDLKAAELLGKSLSQFWREVAVEHGGFSGV